MTDLMEAAMAARARAYAPYSGYAVGAAIRDRDGSIWTGCNVENVSFPLSVCAERNAVASMVAGGGRQIAAVAVVTRDRGTPCGGCLQVMLEFSPDPAAVKVYVADEYGNVESYTLGSLMPHAFRSSAVSRTER